MDPLLKNLGKALCFVVFLCVAAFISSYAAIGGARLGGEPFNGPDSIVPPTLGHAILGFGAGAVIFCIAYAVFLAWKKNHAGALGLAFLSTLGLVFVGFFALTVGGRWHQKYQDQQEKAFQADLQQHPEHFEQLVRKAKTTPLSDREYWGFVHMLSVDNFLTEAQLDPVIDLLESDEFSRNDSSDYYYGSNVCAILKHQPVTAKHLHRLYEMYGGKEGPLFGKRSMILEALQKHPKIPADLRQRIEQRRAQKPQEAPSAP